MTGATFLVLAGCAAAVLVGAGYLAGFCHGRFGFWASYGITVTPTRRPAPLRLRMLPGGRGDAA